MEGGLEDIHQPNPKMPVLEEMPWTIGKESIGKWNPMHKSYSLQNVQWPTAMTMMEVMSWNHRMLGHGVDDCIVLFTSIGHIAFLVILQYMHAFNSCLFLLELFRVYQHKGEGIVITWYISPRLNHDQILFICND